tara:strand:- start:291 stop:662 length:372 start_codon:yes stop_codon:yes gene_type:complete
MPGFLPPLVGLAARLAAKKIAAKKFRNVAKPGDWRLKTELLTPQNYNKHIKPRLRDRNLSYKDYRKRYPDVKGVQTRNSGEYFERIVDKNNVPFVDKNPIKILSTKELKDEIKRSGGKIFKRD